MPGYVIQGFFPTGQMARGAPVRNGTLQMRPSAAGAHAGSRSPSANVEIDPARLGLVRGGGKSLPPTLLQKMEAAFVADFSAVRVHIGPQAARLGAVAFTMGNDIYFEPGRYQPDSMHGQELIGHELAHVIQQRQGRVRIPASGVAVLQDAALEAEADRLGMQAARHAHAISANAAPASAGGPDAGARGLFSGANGVPLSPGASVQLRGGSGAFVIQRKTAISFNPANDKAGSVKIAGIEHQREVHNDTQRTLAAYLSGYRQPPGGTCNHHVPYSHIRNEIERLLTSHTNLESAVKWMNGLTLAPAKTYDWKDWDLTQTSDRFSVGAMPKPNIRPTRTDGMTNTKYYAEVDLNREVNDLIWNLANDPRNLFYWPNSTGDANGTQVDEPAGKGPMKIEYIKARLNEYVTGLRTIGLVI